MTAANITNLPVAQQADPSEIMEAVLLAGDLSKLSAAERTSYYFQTCKSLGLNPLTKPFDYIRLSGREVLYAKRDAADQLRKINRISLEIVDRKVTGDLLVVTVRATTPDGRSDEDMGVVSVKGLAGEALANAMLRGMTKAKRRVTLSICGLGMLDESEVRSVLEAEALAGPVSPEPPKPATKPEGLGALKAPTPPPAPPKVPKPAIKVKVPGQPAAEFSQDDGLEAALRAAMEFMSSGICDGRADVVAANMTLLDRIAEKVPSLADDVADLRAAAAMAAHMTPEEPEPESDGFVARFVSGDDDAFPGDIPANP